MPLQRVHSFAGRRCAFAGTCAPTTSGVLRCEDLPWGAVGDKHRVGHRAVCSSEQKPCDAIRCCPFSGDPGHQCGENELGSFIWRML